MNKEHIDWYKHMIMSHIDMWKSDIEKEIEKLEGLAGIDESKLDKLYDQIWWLLEARDIINRG